MADWWWSWWPLATTVVEEIPIPTAPPEPTHPYYPLGVHIAAYEANQAPVHVLIGALAGTLGFTVLSAALIARMANPSLRASGLAVFCWFIMSEKKSQFP